MGNTAPHRERLDPLRAFSPGVWAEVPGDARCSCTWVYAPGTSPRGKDAPWGLKYLNRTCLVLHPVARPAIL